MGPFESGMRRLVPQLASRLGGTPTLCGLLITRRMVSTLSLDLLTAPSVCGALFHNPLTTFPPLTRCTLISVQSQTQMVGSEIRTVACYIGSPQTIVHSCIHLLS